MRVAHVGFGERERLELLQPGECIEAIKATGAKVVAEACLIDRSGGKAKLGVKLIALASLKIPSWEADKLPAHLQDTPAIKPGSRAAP